MSQRKIIKNQSGSTQQILNRDVANGDQYEIPSGHWNDLSINSDIISKINSKDYVVNDGNVDLNSTVALAHIQNLHGVVKEHSDVTLLPFVSDNAPELYMISDASIGQRMMVGEQIFGQTRIDNLVDDNVKIQLHLSIDNNIADKWIQFELSYIKTTGDGDKNMNTPDGTVTFGPIEVPTTPYQIFKSTVSIPSEGFNSEEHYIFLGIKRVAAIGKTEPTNNPIVLRYCKIFYKNLVS